jgi:hypothetical protein
MKTKLVSTKKSSMQHSFRLTLKSSAHMVIVDETESLPTQNSSMQPLSLMIQKSTVAMKSFLVSLLPFGQA